MLTTLRLAGMLMCLFWLAPPAGAATIQATYWGVTDLQEIDEPNVDQHLPTKVILRYEAKGKGTLYPESDDGGGGRSLHTKVWVDAWIGNFHFDRYMPGHIWTNDWDKNYNVSAGDGTRYVSAQYWQQPQDTCDPCRPYSNSVMAARSLFQSTDPNTRDYADMSFFFPLLGQGYTNFFDMEVKRVQLAHAPLPAGILLMLPGLLGLVAIRRLRKRA